MNRNDLIKKEFSITLKYLASTMPLERITVTSLSVSAKLSRGTFYNHFLDIYDLINWTFEQDIIVPLQSYIENHEERWSGITEQCLQKMYADKPFYCQAVKYHGQNNLCDYMRERNLACWRLLISRYMGTDKTMDPDVLEFYVRFTSQSIATAVIQWAEEGMMLPPRQMAQMDLVATRGIYGMIDAANAKRQKDR